MRVAMIKPPHDTSDPSTIARATDRAVFTLTGLPDAAMPVLIAVPHAGRDYPPDILEAMRLPDASTVTLEDRHVDRIATRIVARLSAPLLVANTPRAIIDLNRSPDDIDWTMIAGGRPAGVLGAATPRRARGGLGLVPRRLQGVGEIWKGPVEPEALQWRIDHIHRPYHAALGTALETIRDEWGAALLIDLHSMPPLKPVRRGEPTARFVLGDRFGASCEPMLMATAFRRFAALRLMAAHNRPYAGGYVLDRHANPARGIHAFQLEVCRSAYLDADLAEISGDCNTVADMLAEVIRELSREVIGIGRGENLPMAAE